MGHIFYTVGPTTSGTATLPIKNTNEYSTVPHHGRNKRTRLHRALTDRLYDRTSLVFPSSKRLEQLHNLIPFALSHVVDAHRAHLDVILEQKVKQPKQAVQLFVVRLARESTVRYGRTSKPFHRLSDPEQLESTTYRASGRYLQRTWKMVVGPLDKVRLNEGMLIFA
jgi:hypothetical protein